MNPIAPAWGWLSASQNHVAYAVMLTALVIAVVCCVAEYRRVSRGPQQFHCERCRVAVKRGRGAA